jgi:hypothetical protein
MRYPSHFTRFRLETLTIFVGYDFHVTQITAAMFGCGNRSTELRQHLLWSFRSFTLHDKFHFRSFKEWFGFSRQINLLFQVFESGSPHPSKFENAVRINFGTDPPQLISVIVRQPDFVCFTKTPYPATFVTHKQSPFKSWSSPHNSEIDMRIWFFYLTMMSSL